MTGIQQMDDPNIFTYGLSSGNEKREIFVMKEIALRFSRSLVLRLRTFLDPFHA